MTKILLPILVISLIGNFLAILILYKFYRTRNELTAANKSVERLTDILDEFYPTRMVFLHHSVGYGILRYGGLEDSLRKMGIMIKSATYGDDIGNKTDILDWLPKFRNDVDSILKFKSHPNLYYADDRANDIVMFKSCFPNSDITAEGEEPGDPLSRSRTITNLQAAFEQLRDETSKHPDRLFIYMTAPPLVPGATTPENALRARKFNRWLVNEFLPRYRLETGLENLVIFDLYDILAGDDNYLREEYRIGKPDDSHPNVEANKIIARKFMEFFRPIWENWQVKSDRKQDKAGL